MNAPANITLSGTDLDKLRHPFAPNQISKLAQGLTKKERACLLTIDETDLKKRAPIPDSMWHGEKRFLRAKYNQRDPSNLSPLGLALKAHIERTTHD